MTKAAEEPTDEALMSAYVAGDQAAFSQLFARYSPRLFAFTRRHLATDEEAREVVQQTFFQLHLSRFDFRTDSKLRPWLYTIAMNLVRDFYRKRTRRREAPLEGPAEKLATAPAGPRLEDQERAARVRRALDELPRNQREVVELHWFEERPFAEVATIVGASEGAVRVRAHRAYTRLKALLEGELE